MPPPRNRQSLSGYTMLFFGASCLVVGVSSLLSPESMLAPLHLDRSAIPAVRANGLAAIAMSIYYTLAAYQKNRLFFAASVPMRLLTTVVFLGQGWTAPALWEGFGAVVTAFALLWEGH